MRGWAVANVERLKLIQSLIERMARNSFALKGWTVTVMAALLGLAAHQSDRRFGLIAIYVLVALAGLDAYYLALERSYRRLYDSAVTAPETEWGLRADRVTLADVLGALASPSIFLLHGFSLVSSLIVLLVA
jgi:hypothetical protein